MWKLNSKDSVRRTFCLAQPPEPLNASDKDQKAAVKLCDSLGVPRTISEITKERLRRAGNKVKADTPPFSGDTGFLVFKLATSNIRAWNPNPVDLVATLFDHQDHLLDGRSESDVLYEEGGLLRVAASSNWLFYAAR